MLVLYFQTSYAQYDGLQITLEIINPHKKSNRLRCSLYKENPTLYLISIKNNPVFKADDYDTWLERDSDTIIKISEEEFNRIAMMTMNLSSSMIFKGMNPSNPLIGNDGYGVNLELDVTMDKIYYSIWCPSYNTKERNLEPFLEVCKDILLLAKMKPKDYF